MCFYECKGDFYRGCQHYVLRYYTGERKDCNDPNCKNSDVHKHPHASSAADCACNAVRRDNRTVVNLFQFKCDECSARDYRY